MSSDLGEQLYHAAINGKDEEVRDLLQRGANKEWVDGSGDTALSWASNKGHLVIAQLLLEHGADKEHASSNGGWTALIIASYNNRLAIARLLLERGANL